MHLLLLTQVDDPELKKAQDELVRPTIDWLMTLRFPSGNYPSSIGSVTGDKLVHWCHGAPGWIHLFILAYKVRRLGNSSSRFIVQTLKIHQY